MQIEDNMIVTFDYRLTDDDGLEIDSSEGRDPLAYLHGSDAIVAGLERALTGKSAGDSFEVRILPEDAYGERDDDLEQEVPREQFAAMESLEEGMEFEVETDDGPMIITIVEVGEEVVTVDGNHDLAGVALTFAVTVREVRQATPEELEHGHAHGPGGHEH